MKSLALVAAAAALFAAPAFAADTTPNATGNSTPASVTALNPAQHTFAIGQRVPAGFAANRNVIKEPEKYGLAKPGFDHEWLMIENNVYLISTINDTVEQLGPAKAPVAQ
jgi:opacity protein-like surface antigen